MQNVDYRREFIDLLLNRSQNSDRRASADSASDGPSRRESYFFQFDSNRQSVSGFKDGEPLHNAPRGMRFSVGQGEMVPASNKEDGSLLQGGRSETCALAEQLSEPSKTQRDPWPRRWPIFAGEVISRSSRNLRDLLKPHEEDAFSMRIRNPERGHVRGLSARHLLKRVFNWRTSASFDRTPPQEEPAELVPIEPKEEPLTLDVPLPPVSTPKPWTCPAAPRTSSRKSERLQFLGSPIIRKMKAAAERRISVGLRIQRGQGCFGSSDDTLSIPRPRRPTDPDTPRRKSIFTESMRRRSCLVSSSSLPPMPFSETPAKLETQKPFPKMWNDSATQTELTTLRSEAMTQTEIPDDDPSTAARNEDGDEDDRGVVDVEAVRLSTGSESHVKEFPTGFVRLRPVDKAPPEKDKGTQALLNALETKLLDLNVSTRMSVATHIMRSLNCENDLRLRTILSL